MYSIMVATMKIANVTDTFSSTSMGLQYGIEHQSYPGCPVSSKSFDSFKEINNLKGFFFYLCILIG